MVNKANSLIFVLLLLIIISASYVLFFDIFRVTSDSMSHTKFKTEWWNSADDWWSSQAICDNVKCTQEEYYFRYHITKDEFSKFPLSKGLEVNDYVLVLKTKSVQKGDIIVFRHNSSYIVHRVILENDSYCLVKGDSNMKPDMKIDNVSIENITGIALIKLP